MRRGVQLLSGFIEADHRALGIVGPMIDIQHVLHLGYEMGRGLADTPAFETPGGDFIFLSATRTLSLERLSTISRATNRSANSRTLQRACPWGGLLQAKAISLASTSPVSLLGSGPGRALSCRAASKPSFTKRLRTLATVFLWQPTASATRASARLCPWLLSPKSKMRARVNSLAGCTPLRTSACRCWRCGSVREIEVCLLMLLIYLLCAKMTSTCLSEH